MKPGTKLEYHSLGYDKDGNRIEPVVVNVESVSGTMPEASWGKDYPPQTMELSFIKFQSASVYMRIIGYDKNKVVRVVQAEYCKIISDVKDHECPLLG